MSNLKKYLKVYKEDAKHKKAFQQYMMVISENQDFFTRHEVNEFLTDMIKDGTLVYDEGWKQWIAAITLAATLTGAALKASPKDDIGPKKNSVNIENHLDKLAENQTKQQKETSKQNAKEIQDAKNMENYEQYKNIYQTFAKTDSKNKVIKLTTFGSLSEDTLKKQVASISKEKKDNFLQKYKSFLLNLNQIVKDYHEINNKMPGQNNKEDTSKYDKQKQIIEKIIPGNSISGSEDDYDVIYNLGSE